MKFNFFPNQFNFFNLFDEQASFAVDAARHFKKAITDNVIDENFLKTINDIEHQGDEAAHAIIEHLNKTFITPFDREDIYALTKELDDVIDMINTIVSRLRVYKIAKANKNLLEFATLIEESVLGVATAIKGMHDMKKTQSVMDACVEINRLENEGDSLRDKVLMELFETERDPIAVIKWKEIYQDAETVLDICEDVAHVVESILVKQS